MKIIDLLNKIANGEQPKKIKYYDDVYEFDCYEGEWGYLNKEYCRNKWFANEIECDLPEQLNDEVEIIEDKPEQKPITKKDLEALGYAFGEMRKALQNGWNKSLNNEPFKEDKKIEKIPMVNEFESNIISHNQARIKINEIIDYLNKGDK